MVPPRLSQDQRKASILQAVRPLFAEKGFKGVTSRELAEAAGISEALLFRHFPSKEALYAGVQVALLEGEAQAAPPIELLPECTETLVFMTGFLLLQIAKGEVPGGDDLDFRRLILTSLMEGGDFARQALQGMPSRINRKLAACLEAAIRSGDARPGGVQPWVAGWFTNYVGLMLMAHLSPEVPIIDFQANREELAQQAQWFCLRGMGLRDEAIQRCLAAPPPFPFPPPMPNPGRVRL